MTSQPDRGGTRSRQKDEKSETTVKLLYMMPMEGRKLMPEHFADAGWRGPRPRSAVTVPAATYMAAVVNSLWHQNEGAAADGVALSAETQTRLSGNGRCLRSRPVTT